MFVRSSSAKVSARSAARSESGSAAVSSIVFAVELVRVTTCSASWRPVSEVPKVLATAFGTSPVVARIATCSTLVKIWSYEEDDDGSSSKVLVAL